MFPNLLSLLLFLHLTASSIFSAEALSCPPKFGSDECMEEMANAPTSLQRACSEVPFASGCTIHRGCEAHHSSSNGCKSFNALVSICLEFPSLKSCSKLTNACGETLGVLQCDGVVDLDLPTTEVAYNAMKKICGSHYMTGCDHCSTSKEFATAVQDPHSFTDACYDPLGVYAHMCIEMDMIPCDPWIEWCNKPATFDIPELCDTPDQTTMAMGGPSSHHKETRMTHTRAVQAMEGMSMTRRSSVAQADLCVQDPTNSSCWDYVYKEEKVLADVNSLCGTGRGGMPWMPSCNVWQDCRQRQDHKHYCYPFTILATICADMPMMRGCASYNSLCGEGSRVKQCKEHGAIPYAPKTMPTQKAIVDACHTHSMPQCSQCPRQGKDCPEPMKTLSEMCHAMPSMKLCQNYTRFCSATHDAFASFCDLNSGDYLPPMRMYFHAGQRDIILFRDWIPESTTGYAFSFLAVVAMGIILQALKMGRTQLENYWHKEIMAAKEAVATQTEASAGKESNVSPRQISFIAVAYRNVIRSVLTGVIATLDFALMLVAMTFNVGLFIGVVLGLALGTLVLGQVPERNYVYKKEPLAGQINRQPYGDTNEGCCT